MSKRKLAPFILSCNSLIQQLLVKYLMFLQQTNTVLLSFYWGRTDHNQINAMYMREREREREKKPTKTIVTIHKAREKDKVRDAILESIFWQASLRVTLSRNLKEGRCQPHTWQNHQQKTEARSSSVLVAFSRGQQRDCMAGAEWVVGEVVGMTYPVVGKSFIFHWKDSYCQAGPNILWCLHTLRFYQVLLL